MGKDFEERIAALSTRQHGVLTRVQLLAGGLSASRVDRLVRSGRLRALHHGVYLAIPFAVKYSREMAAVLACGDGALLSHFDAAVLWEARDRATTRVEVTTEGNRGQRMGVRAHRVRGIPEEDRAEKHGIPVTSPERTILDLAAVLGKGELEAIIARAERQGLVTAKSLELRLERAAGRAGARALRALLGMPGGVSLTRSDAEDAFLDLVREAGLPPAETNVKLGRYEIDFLWRAEGIAVEVDGFRYHGSRQDFERDRRKDAALLADGITVIRLSWRQITRQRLTTQIQLAQALALAGARTRR